MASYATAAKPTNEDKETPVDVAGWLSEIEVAHKDMWQWNDRCKKIRDLYRYEKSSSAKKRQYQIFWANIQTLKPKVYAKTPKAVVGSRFKDGDPVARVVATLIERGLQFNFDFNNYGATYEQVRDDYLLYGRGVPRLRYEPIMAEAEIEDGLDEFSVEGERAAVQDETEDAAPQEILKFENLHLDYVQRDDFIHPKARTWAELPWIAYRAFLCRSELVERFGQDIGSKIGLDTDPARINDGTDSTHSSTDDKATIYEIWDKTNRQVLWIAKGFGEVLDTSEPYLKITGFFPSPRPAYATLTNDSLVPVPGYVYYQDQIQEINDLTARIASLTDALKLVGFYPAGPEGEGSPQIERAMMPGVENKMIAVKSWATFTEAGKGNAPIIWLPVEMVAKLITECVNLRKQLIEDVREITGISDIMRGQSDPNETMGAQQLKAQYSMSRVEGKKELERLCRDVTQMAGEIIAEQFQVETLMKIANVKIPTQAEVMQQFAPVLQQYQQAMQMFPQAQQQWQAAAQQAQAQGQQPPPPPQQPQQPQMPNTTTVEMVEAMMRDGAVRRFRLDIETDSTVSADEAQDKADRSEFIKSTSQFVVAWGPIIAGKPELAPLAAELLKFGVRAFPVARELEDVIEKMADMMIQQSQQPKPPPQPSPEDQIKLQTTQIKGQAEQSKAQIGVQAVQVKAQAEQAKAGMEMQRAQQEHQQGTVQAAQQHALDTHAAATDHAIQMKTLQQQEQMDQTKFVANMAMELFKANQAKGGPNGAQ